MKKGSLSAFVDDAVRSRVFELTVRRIKKNNADADDNAILATAIAAGADLIVTGDKSHLLTLRLVKGIPIVTPRAALRYLRNGG